MWLKKPLSGLEWERPAPKSPCNGRIGGALLDYMYTIIINSLTIHACTFGYALLSTVVKLRMVTRIISITTTILWAPFSTKGIHGRMGI